ncbi:hypothetical protein CK203_107957, partial [Vitis vinifera]
MHSIDFAEFDDHIHMLSWDEPEPEPLVSDEIHEIGRVTLGPWMSTPFRLTPEVASVQTTTIEPLTFPHYSVRTPFVLISNVVEVKTQYVDVSQTPHVDDAHTSNVQYVIRGGRVIRQQPPAATRPLEGTSSQERSSSSICPPGQWFGPELRAYDSTRREVMGTLEIELLIGPATFVTMFQVLRIPTSFNLLLGRPWIHRAGAIPSSLHQKMKFIHEGQVIIVQSTRDMFISAEPVLQISHSDDDLQLTGFTFDEVQTLEMKDFCQEFVAMSFDQHGSIVVLDMMRGMSYLPGMGLSRHQHGPSEFMTILDHDVPFGLGFVPTEADYRYMARLRKERVRSRLTHTPFDYPIRPYTMRLSYYFVKASKPQTHSDVIIGGLSTTQEVGLQSLVRQLRLSDGAPSTSTTAFTVLSSLDRMSLMTLYFPDEIDERGTFAEVGDIVNGTALHDEYTDEMLALSLSQIEETVQPGLASPFDLFGVSTIKLIEEIPTAPTPEPIEGIIVGDVLFKWPCWLC